MTTAGWMPRAISRSSCSDAAISVRPRATPRAGLVVARELRLQQRQLERHGDEPLLRAVVEVALEALALAVAGLDDAGPRAAQLLQARAQLDLQARVLERDRRPRRRRRAARGSSSSDGSCSERGDGLALALDHGQRHAGRRAPAARPRGRRGRRSVSNSGSQYASSSDGSRSARARASRRSAGSDVGAQADHEVADGRARQAQVEQRVAERDGRDAEDHERRRAGSRRSADHCIAPNDEQHARASPGPATNESTTRASGRRSGRPACGAGWSAGRSRRGTWR